MEDTALQILMAGDSVISWLGALVAAFLIKFIASKISHDKARFIVSNALHEVFEVVAEVEQVYVKALKAANEDGVLTDAEKKEAKAKAMAKLKSNIGAAGLVKLGKVLGIDAEKWLAGKVESAVHATPSSAPDPT